MKGAFAVEIKSPAHLLKTRYTLPHMTYLLRLLRGMNVTIRLLTILLLLTLIAVSTTGAQESIDLNAIDAYVKEQMDALGIPDAALGIVQGDEFIFRTKGTYRNNSSV